MTITGHTFIVVAGMGIAVCLGAITLYTCKLLEAIAAYKRAKANQILLHSGFISFNNGGDQ